MKKKLTIAAVLLGLWSIIAPDAQGDSGVKLSNNKPFNSASASLSYDLTDSPKIALRQDIGVDEAGTTNSHWKGATRGYYDANYSDVDFGSGKLRPYVGANAVYVYGSPINDKLIAGPEVGLKIQVQPKTLIRVQAEYQSLYHAGDQIEEAFNDGSMEYSLGIGLRF